MLVYGRNLLHPSNNKAAMLPFWKFPWPALQQLCSQEVRQTKEMINIWVLCRCSSLLPPEESPFHLPVRIASCLLAQSFFSSLFCPPDLQIRLAVCQFPTSTFTQSRISLRKIISFFLEYSGALYKDVWASHWQWSHNTMQPRNIVGFLICVAIFGDVHSMMKSPADVFFFFPPNLSSDVKQDVAVC